MKEHSDIIEKALEQGYLSFEGDSIIYNTKKRSKQNYTKPEEKVRAEVFARLIIEKEYPLSHIAIEVPVKMGSETKRADIVVYKNAKHQKAFIVVELKNSNQKDLREALKQALSYAGSGSLRADYALATNGKEKFALYIKEDGNDSHDDIPPYGGNAPIWKYLRDSKNNNITKITTDELYKKFIIIFGMVAK